MDKEKIINILKKMPNFKENLIEKYNQLTQIAINIVETKLKNKKDKDNDILTMLCASLVNLWVVAEICANSPTGSFSGNGYKIKKDSKKQLNFAKKLFENWRAIACNLLTDEGFSFFAVRKVYK